MPEADLLPDEYGDVSVLVHGMKDPEVSGFSGLGFQVLGFRMKDLRL